MRITLSDEARRYMGLFAEITDVHPTDCLVEDDRLVLVVPPGEMATAIGPDGYTVERVESRAGIDVDLVEGADTPEAFVANTLAPAAVRNVTVSEQGGSVVAYAEVPPEDRGAAIGSDGRNIDVARRLAARHFDIDDIELA